MLLDLSYLEAKAEAGSSLTWRSISAFGQSITLPKSHPGRRHLRLIELALRSDLYFIARHPTTLFQCLWNRCWWYDRCAEAACRITIRLPGVLAGGSGRPLVATWHWAGCRAHCWNPGAWEKEQRSPGFLWVRSRAPPPFPLGGHAELVLLGACTGEGCMSAAFSPDGRRVVSRFAGRAGLGRGERAPSWSALAVRGGLLMSRRVLTSDGRRIVTASDDGTARVWDAESGAELACIRGTGRGCSWERGVLARRPTHG